MNSELIIETIIEALKHMDSPRFFKTERGFQGRFACALGKKTWGQIFIIDKWLD